MTKSKIVWQDRQPNTHHYKNLHVSPKIVHFAISYCEWVSEKGCFCVRARMHARERTCVHTRYIFQVSLSPWPNALSPTPPGFSNKKVWQVGSVVRIPSGAQEKLWVFPSQKGCADSLSVCPTSVRIRMHTKDHVRTLYKEPVVHIRVRWIMETRK